MRHHKLLVRLCLFAAAGGMAAAPASAVIVGGDNAAGQNDSAPAGSIAYTPWQYHAGPGGLIGTAIAPNYFITAQHVGANVGDHVNFGGQQYTTTDVYNQPGTDLRIFKVDGDIANYAPLSRSADVAGKQLLIIGRGTDRGDELTTSDGQLVGWAWDGWGGTQRWGLNTADGLVNGDPGQGLLLKATFKGGADATVSSGDSGGGFFVNNNGQWELGGVTFAVDRDMIVNGQQFSGAIIGQGMYASSIAANQSWIDSIIGGATSASVGIPEPASAGLLLVGITAVALRRKRA